MDAVLYRLSICFMPRPAISQPSVLTFLLFACLGARILALDGRRRTSVQVSCIAIF